VASENENRVLDHLRRLILIGQYPDGSRLPPERQLTLELGIGRGPVRRALGVLEAEGKITRHVGLGTFVGSCPKPQPTHRQSLASKSVSPSELMETRLTVEPRVAAMAALRAHDDDIDYLRLAVSRSENATDWSAWQRWDETFHRTIALSATNTLLADLVEMLNTLRREDNRHRVRRKAVDPDWRQLLVQQHRAIAEAVANRDPQEAAQSMREHLLGVEERLFGDQQEINKLIERL